MFAFHHIAEGREVRVQGRTNHAVQLQHQIPNERSLRVGSEQGCLNRTFRVVDPTSTGTTRVWRASEKKMSTYQFRAVYFHSLLGELMSHGKKIPRNFDGVLEGHAVVVSNTAYNALTYAELPGHCL
jgi:hypothetical protein